MEVRRSAAIGKPMVDIGIEIIRGPEIELVSITSASCRAAALPDSVVYRGISSAYVLPAGQA
jgi:hypothetical protein